jgi:hypothetical protein
VKPGGGFGAELFESPEEGFHIVNRELDLGLAGHSAKSISDISNVKPE